MQDPYVRKTAAICVAKLYDINPDLVEVQGFLDMLQELISDSNPTVVANAVAALSEIQASSGEVQAVYNFLQMRNHEHTDKNINLVCLYSSI